MKRSIMLAGLLLCGLFGFSAVSFAGWREVEAVPTGRWGLAAAAVDDQVYAIAGQDDSPKTLKSGSVRCRKGQMERGKGDTERSGAARCGHFQGEDLCLWGNLRWDCRRGAGRGV